MGEYSQINPEIPGTINKVNFNPSEPVFRSILSDKHSILDVGCGENAYVSWQLSKDNQILVACDPDISKAAVKDKENILRAKKGLYIFFDKEVDSIYKFNPEVISFVAPNQMDVVKGLYYDTDKFLNGKGRKLLYIVLENRTEEAAILNKEAIQKTNEYMIDSNFEILFNDETEDIQSVTDEIEREFNLEYHFSPKTRNLGSLNRLTVGVRNSR